MFPIVMLLGLTGLVMGILQSHGEFDSSAIAPVLWNVTIIVFLIGVTPFLDADTRIYAYAVGILVGTVIQLLYLLPGLRGKGPFPLSLGFANPHVRRVLALMVPVTIAPRAHQRQRHRRHPDRAARQRGVRAGDRRGLPPLHPPAGHLQRGGLDRDVPDDLAPRGTR